MKARFFDLVYPKKFLTEQGSEFNRPGGPRSFHKCTYKNTSIILIGETHDSIPSELGEEYKSVLVDYFNNSSKSVLFLEWCKDKTEKSTHKGCSFISHIKDIPGNNKLKICYSDTRSYGTGFLELLPFLVDLAETSIELFAKYASINKNMKSNNYHPQAWEFKKLADELLSSHKKKHQMDFYFQDIYKYLESQISSLSCILTKYEQSNSQLNEYLMNCLQKIKNAVELTHAFEAKYRSVFQIGEGEIKQSLAEICIEMALQDDKFFPPNEVRDILYLYATYFFDATIACDVWDALCDQNQDQKTLMVMAGDIHIDNLVTLLNNICTNDISIESKREGVLRIGQLISPPYLNEFLHNNFEHVSTQSCSLM